MRRQAPSPRERSLVRAEQRPRQPLAREQMPRHVLGYEAQRQPQARNLLWQHLRIPHWLRNVSAAISSPQSTLLSLIQAPFIHRISPLPRFAPPLFTFFIITHLPMARRRRLLGYEAQRHLRGHEARLPPSGREGRRTSPPASPASPTAPAAGILNEMYFNLKFSGNEVYYTARSLLEIFFKRVVNFVVKKF